MKLAGKMNLVILCVVIVLVAGFSSVFRFVVLESYLNIDNRQAVESMGRCRAGLEREIMHLGRFVHDWSSWDDTYRFAIDRNREFVHSNLTDEVFHAQKINLIHIYDASHRPVWTKTLDRGLDREIDLDLERDLPAETFERLVDQSDPGRSVTGVVLTGRGPFILASYPILKSDNRGPGRGALIMGKFLDSETLRVIQQQSGVPLEIHELADRALPASATKALAGGTGEGGFLLESDRKTTTVYYLIRDISGRPVLVMKARMERAIADEGRWAYFVGLMSLLALGFIILVSVSVLLKNFVIAPVEALTDRVLHAGDAVSSAGLSETDRTDEIGVLSREFGAMFKELARRNEELDAHKRRLEQIIDFLPDPTYAIDEKGRVIAWNRSMEEMTRIAKADMLGQDHSQAALPLYGEPGPLLVDLLLGGKEPCEGRYHVMGLGADRVMSECHAPALNGGMGAHLWTVAALLYDEEGAVAGAIECIRDITEKKKADELVQRLGLTVDQLLDGVLMTGLDGTVIYVNQAWRSMHRFVEDDALGRHIGVFHTHDQMASEVAPFMEEVKSKGCARARISHIAEDDRIFTALTSAFVLKDTDGEPSAIVWIARDITQEMKMEEQLHQAQKMEVVGRLAGGVAHDLNNMLSPILGYSELVLRGLGEESRLHDDVVQIKSAAERAKNLTQQLLAFSRKQVLDMKVTDLAEVVSGYAKMLRRTIREDISIQILHNVCTRSVKVDVDRVGQVLMNLAINAADSMPGGGTITVETSQVTLDEAYAGTHEGVEPGDYAVLAVSDTGSGMDSRVMEHVFEPFFTTKETGKGTGLGLATVYGIVRQHGGHISVYSEPGIGSSFRVYFPSFAAAGRDLPEQASAEKGAFGTETIAVAEDDPHVRALACSILKKFGYKVITADRARDLLDELKEAVGSVDLLLTDVIMPDMNGRDLFERLREHRPDMKVLFMSGYTGEIIARHGILEEGVHLVQKPFTIASLTNKVRQVLDA